jgi:tRNA pseudouridine65 synthase
VNPTLLFRDPHIVAFDKPSGLSVHRGLDAADETLVRFAHAIDPELQPVHRLDRGTSGVVLFARGEALSRANRSFREAEVHKLYLALVRGDPGEAEIEVDHPIPKAEGGPRVDARTKIRRRAVATVDSPLRETRYAWVEARPETGRFHQVRRHLKHLGHPIVGDANYGKSEHNRFIADLTGCARLCLHARALSLPHPMTSEPLLLRAPLPPLLRRALDRLGLPFDEDEALPA